MATADQEKKLKNKLLVTGLAVDVKPYECKRQDSDELDEVEPNQQNVSDLYPEILLHS